MSELRGAEDRLRATWMRPAPPTPPPHAPNSYAKGKIAGPFCGMRAMVLKFSSEHDVDELNWLNEA